MKTILLFLSFFVLPLVAELFPAAYLSPGYTLARLLAIPCPGSAAAVSSPPRLLQRVANHHFEARLANHSCPKTWR
ncbi:MAG: hypothetical protein QNK82_13640 [Akkermansiaceae bacterium]